MKKSSLLSIAFALAVTGSAWADTSAGKNAEPKNSDISCIQAGETALNSAHSNMMGGSSMNYCGGQMTPAMMQMHQNMMETPATMKETYSKSFSQMTPSERAAVIRLSRNNGTAQVNQF